jgi:hypothetical protein
MNGSPFHTEFVETGIKFSEESILRSNNIYDNIVRKVPDLNTTAMGLNSYKVYYKPYAMWTS